MRFVVFLGLIFSLASQGLLAQRLLPPIHNYRISDYKAATQNWDVSVDDSGALYVANKQGLLHFNGELWKLYKLPNETIIRSVKVIGQKIYTGSYEEFGFWEKNSYGTLEYTSLTHLITNHVFTNEEIWEIIPLGQDIFFRSFSTIFKYDGQSIEPIDIDFLVNDLLVQGESLLIAGGQAGVFEWNKGQLNQLVSRETIAPHTVTNLSLLGDSVLIGTKLAGCYIWKEASLKVWDHPVNLALKKYQLNKIKQLENGKIAFGTIKKGVFLLDKNHSSYVQIDKEAGLQNNTVLSIESYKDQLWLGLDNGVDRIKTEAPLRYFTDFSGTVGTVYDIAVHHGITYLGSNTGLYYFKEEALVFMEGSQGQVWDLSVVDDDLLAGHNTGTFKVTGAQLSKISDYSGGYELIPTSLSPHVFLQGTYNGLVRFEKTPAGKWKTEPILGINYPVKQLVFERPNVLWVAHPYKGFYRLILSENLDRLLETQSFEHYTNINPYNVKVYVIKNRIVIKSSEHWYTYNSILDQLEPFQEFEHYNKTDIVYHDNEHIWFLSSETSRELVTTDLKRNLITISERNLKNRLVPGVERVIPIDDNSAMITLNDGFAHINKDHLDQYLVGAAAPKPQLNTLMASEEPLEIQSNFEIPYKQAAFIEFLLSAPSLISPNFKYELSGPRSEKKESDHGVLSFQGLPFGTYKLQVSAVNVNGMVSPPLTVNFSISPPWYWSPYAMTAYLAAFVFLALLVRWVTKIKLRKKQAQVEARMERQQEEALLAMEKEKFAKEIKLKQNELTGTSLVLAKKNELLLELKQMLANNYEGFKSKKHFESIQSKIDKSLNDSEEWNDFEMNFNELHQDFFEKLLQSYPKLTPKDLKLAAYLKMNLTSKEIAPLLGISVRGVEIHRYRLRKKLGLDSSKHLSNFLITHS